MPSPLNAKEKEFLVTKLRELYKRMLETNAYNGDHKKILGKLLAGEPLENGNFVVIKKLCLLCVHSDKSGTADFDDIFKNLISIDPDPQKSSFIVDLTDIIKQQNAQTTKQKLKPTPPNNIPVTPRAPFTSGRMPTSTKRNWMGMNKGTMDDFKSGIPGSSFKQPRQTENVPSSNPPAYTARESAQNQAAIEKQNLIDFINKANNEVNRNFAAKLSNGTWGSEHNFAAMYLQMQKYYESYLNNLKNLKPELASIPAVIEFQSTLKKIDDLYKNKLNERKIIDAINLNIQQANQYLDELKKNYQSSQATNQATNEKQNDFIRQCANLLSGWRAIPHSDNINKKIKEFIEKIKAVNDQFIDNVNVDKFRNEIEKISPYLNQQIELLKNNLNNQRARQQAQAEINKCNAWLVKLSPHFAKYPLDIKEKIALIEKASLTLKYILDNPSVNTSTPRNLRR